MSRKGLIYPDYSLVYFLDRILSFGSQYAKVRKDRWSKERMLHKVRHWKTKRAIEEDRTVWNIELFRNFPHFSHSALNWIWGAIYGSDGNILSSCTWNSFGDLLSCVFYGKLRLQYPRILPPEHMCLKSRYQIVNKTVVLVLWKIIMWSDGLRFKRSIVLQY